MENTIIQLAAIIDKLFIVAPWFIILICSIRYYRKHRNRAAVFLICGTLLWILSYFFGVVRECLLRIFSYQKVKPYLAISVMIQNAIWIIGGFIFASGFCKLVKSTNETQQSSGGDSSTRANAGLEPPQK